MNLHLKANNYIFIPQFIRSDKAKKLAKKFEEYANTEKLGGDDQAPNSSSMYNYTPFVELLTNKTSKISKIVGEKVIPTYTYARVYKKGDDLKIHKDRDSCELSLTINLDQQNEWPIYIRKPNGEVSKLTLHPGDAMIYLGCEAEHWREELTDEKHVQVFLHYVFSKGSRSKFAFDLRTSKRSMAEPNVPKNEFIGNFVNDLTKYIVYLEDMVPSNICDQILSEYANTEEWCQTKVGSDGGVENPEVRGAMVINISVEETINKNQPFRQQLDAQLFECMNRAISSYKEKFPLCYIEDDSGYELLRYQVGQGYNQHTDNFKSGPRAVSCSVCLNDDYSGGEFTFFDGQISIKQKKGSVLLFPSSFQYPHQVNKVTSGTRYAIITWFR